ncbi:MAG: hypothetical protein AAGI88_15485 [Pseudomonadota bacterium]
MRLPGGYVDLGPVKLHEADLELHTIDLRRFKAFAPQAVRLSQVGPDSAEAEAIFREARENGRFVALQLTCIEYGLLMAKLAVTVSSCDAKPAPPRSDAQH